MTSTRQKQATIGIISDTHGGLLRPEALEALRGSHAIIHAGDVGERAILSELQGIAPVTAVRGNVDTEVWARQLPKTNVLEIAGISIYVLHRYEDLDLKPAAAGFAAVVFGHSHRPSVDWRSNVLFFNPGSAGPRRFTLPVSVGKLVVENGKIQPEIVELTIVAH